MLQNAGVLRSLTCTCASRHSGVRFFHICSSKSGPYPSVFSHFDLHMYFSPQRRANFPDRNFQNRSRTEVFWSFWLANVLRATAACDFWTSELPKLVSHWGFWAFWQMCFAPQRRATFEHRNFQKRSRTEVFWAFWLEMCFAPQRRAIFHLSAEQLPPHPPL